MIMKNKLLLFSGGLKGEQTVQPQGSDVGTGFEPIRDVCRPRRLEVVVYQTYV
jgi:hypothetical protein